MSAARVHRYMSLEDRLLAQTCDGTNGCWVWTGNTSAKGYGRVRIGAKKHTAHRVVYELLVGPIPNDLQLDHLCGVPACVNPAHLEPVTAEENNWRRDSRVSVACPNGHQRTAENTEVRTHTRTSRRCRDCQNEGRRRHLAALSTPIQEP